MKKILCFFAILMLAITIEAMGSSSSQQRVLLQNNIRSIFFSEGNMELITFNDEKFFYSLDTIQSLIFDMDNTMEITNPDISTKKISIYFDTAGNIIVDSKKFVKSLTLFNLSGKILKTTKNSTSLEISGLSAGVYFLCIETADGVVTEKFIK